MVTLLLFSEFGPSIPTAEMIRDPVSLEARVDKDRWENVMIRAGKRDLIRSIYERLDEIRFLSDVKLLKLLSIGADRGISLPPKLVQPEKELSTRERNNLMAIIAALLKLCEPKEKGNPVVVRAVLDQLGFDSPKEEKIRQVLKRAKADTPNWDSVKPS